MDVTVSIELTDNRDGCTYTRVYVDTPNWSASVSDLASIVLPGCYPDYMDRRSMVSIENTSGILRDENGTVIGTYAVSDVTE